MSQDGILDPEFLALARERMERLEGQAVTLATEISRLSERQTLVQRQIQSLKDLVEPIPQRSTSDPGAEGIGEPNPLPQPSSADVDTSRKATSDDVVALIREHGPMHYTDIHAAILEQGRDIGGQGNANTLLSRFFNDQRLIRVKRGTYGVRGE